MLLLGQSVYEEYVFAMLSFSLYSLESEDQAVLEDRKSTRWKGPGSLNHLWMAIASD